MACPFVIAPHPRGAKPPAAGSALAFPRFPTRSHTLECNYVSEQSAAGTARLEPRRYFTGSSRPRSVRLSANSESPQPSRHIASFATVATGGPGWQPAQMSRLMGA